MGRPLICASEIVADFLQAFAKERREEEGREGERGREEKRRKEERKEVL